MERRNAWLTYTEAEELEMEKLAKLYRNFLDHGKTERECVTQIVKEAEEAGYESLDAKLAKGETLKEARKNAYAATEWISFANKYMRHDIGKAIDEA